MTDKEKQEWLEVKYPLTVITDRYDGTYSGAKWLAFPLDYDKIPSDVDASDPECAHFWKDYKEPVGKGAYASDAVVDLVHQMREFEPEESEDERIRQQCIIAVNIAALTDGGLLLSEASECLAWLEKQKDSVSNAKYIEDVAHAFEDGRKKGIKEKQKENPKSADSIPSDCVSDAKCEDRWHKVADFLPDTPREVICKDYIGNYFIGRYYEGSYEGSIWEVSVYDDEDKTNENNPEVVMWCEIPSEKQKEQKREWKDRPANWNKEKEAEYQRELSIMPKPDNPAEWSDEDEKNLELVTDCVYEFYPDPVMKYKLKDWLKSLRPSWKPSEEQMYALAKAVTLYGGGLDSLYQDLKKL